MFRKIYSVSKRCYSCEQIKKNDIYLQRSSKFIYNKIFLSHIFIEEKSQWISKDSNDTHYIGYHPSMRYTVSILNENKLSVGGDVYAVALLPLKNWLVQDRNKVTLFKDSYIASTVTKIVDEESENVLDLYLNANFLSEILSKVRPTGYIVNSVNLNMPPILVGELQTQKDRMFFNPMHKGFPLLSILPEDGITFNNKNTFNNDVFCEMIEWECGCPAIGRLLSSCPLNFNQHTFLNSVTKEPKSNLNLEESIEKLLESFNLKDKPFSKMVLNSLSTELNDLKISEKEIKSRESFLDQCVISIDPIDAKDLDDALHIKALPDGNYEVGVHIADVSHFVKPRSALDKEALSRATSIYLIHKVIPMLPELLSESLCSLNPDVEKLTFSVIFIVNPRGTIISERFIKSVIKPKMRLNYDEASKIIEGDFESLAIAKHPAFNQVKKSVQKLDKIAKVLRKGRIDNGALVLDKIELKFDVDEVDTDAEEDKCAVALPSSFHIKTRSSSHFLIEEWMLLANQAAARLVYNHALSKPTSKVKIGALLRKHSPPDARQNFELIKASKAAGINIGPISSGKLQQKIIDLKSTDPLTSLNLSYICYFNMQLAIYCCAEKSMETDIGSTKPTESPFHHYGLNVALYTHFTSPIRRYADIVVHRQIDAIINNKSTCGISSPMRDEAAQNSNNMRPATRRVQERLYALYMAALLNRDGWRLVKAVILKENKNKLSVMLPFSGIAMWVDLMDLAPWARAVSKSKANITKPLTFQLKYSTDTSQYKVEDKNGFTQYVHSWNENAVARDADSEAVDESLDERIDEVQQMNANLASSAVDSKSSESVDLASIEIRIFEEIDCVLYCSDNKLELLIEMPFPSLLQQMKGDLARCL